MKFQHEPTPFKNLGREYLRRSPIYNLLYLLVDPDTAGARHKFSSIIYGVLLIRINRGSCGYGGALRRFSRGLYHCRTRFIRWYV